MKEEIVKAIKKIVGEREINLDVPENFEYGDYSTNIAMQMFSNPKMVLYKFEEVDGKETREKYKSPREFAEDFVKKLESDKKLAKVVDKIEIAGPGFINFFVKYEILFDNLKYITKQSDAYGKSDYLSRKRINFEFGQPNTHKLPHIGHLFSYVLGSSISNILEYTGADIYRVNYQGDVGPHVAKCLWAFKKENPEIPNKLEDKVKLLQNLYQEGSKKYDEDENAKAEINSLNKSIYDQNPEIMDLYKKTRSWSIDYYKLFEKRLGVDYNRYYFESEVQELGKKGVENALGKVFKKSDGAIIFEGSKYGLHDRVFVTKYGTPTYEAKDTYLEVLKYKEWPYDLLIITTANEQNEYFKVVYKAIELISPKLKGKLKHIGFGMVNLTTGKMSSRTGQIVDAVELVNMTVNSARKLVKDRGELNQKLIDEIAEVVGLGAIKYAFLKSNPLQNVKFNIKESVSFEGNSGPYLQYTYARTQSVLAKSVYQVSDVSSQLVRDQKDRKTGNRRLNTDKLNSNSEELAVLRTLVHFPEVVADAAERYAPNIICNYLYDLAQKFNSFYARHKIINTDSDGITGKVGDVKAQKIIGGDNENLRLMMTSGTGQVLKNGLNLLGIKSPQKM